MSAVKRLQSHLRFLYGPDHQALFRALEDRIRVYRDQLSPWAARFPTGFSEKDTFIIAYGDHVLPADPKTPKLWGLKTFLSAFVRGLVQGVHILPFFPYSSDDGFAVMDFRQVRPDLGTWEDIRNIAQDFVLMVDLVLNHVSSRHPWFQAFLAGDPRYRDFFLTSSDPNDPAWANVMRPRATPLFTPFSTSRGTVYVWTTFSADQVDLNYRNPHVFLEMADTLLYYVAHGARVIRLDAVAFVWKAPYTSCIHLPQAHALVQAFRALLDWAAPWVRIITETNVPHEDNVAYFGDGMNEAHMVYNFSLPPLTLYAFLAGDTRSLTRWAATLTTPSDQTAFFNFLASHDGIGMLPAKGWLSESQRTFLVETVQKHGGHVSYKRQPDGSEEVYELNITWYDALNDPAHPTSLDDARFVASYAVALTLAGVPAVYLSSLFGARNCHPCVETHGYARAINREKFPWNTLQARLTDPDAHEGRVFQVMRRLLAARRACPAFHPHAHQRVLDLDPGVVAVHRAGLGHDVLALISARPEPVTVAVPPMLATGPRRDLLTGRTWNPDPSFTLRLEPYQVAWLCTQPHDV